MKTNEKTIKLGQFLILIFLILVIACSKDKDKGDPLDRDYVGTLRFEYSRSFPNVSELIEINVELYKSGDMHFSQPSGRHYDVTDEEPETVKIREMADIIISSLSGEYKVINDKPYVVIRANTLIDGTMTVWGWDDEYGWVMPVEIPFSLTNPVGSPMNFDFVKVTGFEDYIGATTPAFNGTVTAKWTLGLMPQ